MVTIAKYINPESAVLSKIIYLRKYNIFKKNITLTKRICFFLFLYWPIVKNIKVAISKGKIDKENFNTSNFSKKYITKLRRNKVSK